MTRLDQVFIKAYSKRTASSVEPSSVGSPSQVGPSAHASPQQPIAQYQSSPNVQNRYSSKSNYPSQPLVDQVPPPHISPLQRGETSQAAADSNLLEADETGASVAGPAPNAPPIESFEQPIVQPVSTIAVASPSQIPPFESIATPIESSAVFPSEPITTFPLETTNLEYSVGEDLREPAEDENNLLTDDDEKGDQIAEDQQVTETDTKQQLSEPKTPIIPAPHFKIKDPVADRQEFQPVWEVDRFDWPQLCLDLTKEFKEEFSAAGQQLLKAARLGQNVIAFTSLSRGAGCTTLALCLAHWAKEKGLRVALIDADMEWPELDTQLGLQAPDGWQQANQGETPLNETAITSIEDRLALVPLKSASGLPGNSLSDSRMSDILRQASREFEIVIVDLGPIAVDELHMAKRAEACPIDIAVVVCDVRKTDEETKRLAVKLLRNTGIREVRIAENFSSCCAATEKETEATAS